VIVVCALLCACAAWLALPASTDPRLQRLAGSRRRVSRRRDAPDRSALLASVVAAAGVWVLIGDTTGLVLAAAMIAIVPRALGRLESRADRNRRELLDRQAPLVAELLAATLASGATLRSALSAVGDAVGEPTAGVLRPVVSAIDLGADPAEAWETVEPVPAHRPILDAVIRAARSGAPLSKVLSRIAEDMRRERKTAVEVAARSAGVRAVAPLAACFLPAFLLTGVVPVVVALADGLLAAR
jgi:Flp pilus assembly protein TadB